MTSTVARVSGPADLAASVPELIGFVPTESLVVLALHEPRGRLGLTMRFDLTAAPVLAEEVTSRLVHAKATRTALLVFTDRAHGDGGDGLPLADLMADVVAAVREKEVRVTEALLVSGSTWWSYVCSSSCCPPDGSPLAPADAGAPGLIAAERVLQGGVLYGSRAELEASIAPDLPLGEDVRLAQLDVVAEDLLDRVLADRADTVRQELARLRRLLDRPTELTADSAAEAAVALRVIGVRDGVLAWVPDEAAPVQALMAALARWTPRSEAGPILTVLGAAAYAQGGGALAVIALEAAVQADDRQAFAELLLQALDRQVPPSMLRESLAPFQRAARVGG